MAMEKIGDGLKKILLVGIGAAATTVEKSSQIIDELVKKGEITVEQGKELNQELKRNVKKSLDEISAAAQEKDAEIKETVEKKEEEIKAEADSLEQKIAGMTIEELENLKAFIQKAEDAVKKED